LLRLLIFINGITMRKNGRTIAKDDKKNKDWKAWPFKIFPALLSIKQRAGYLAILFEVGADLMLYKFKKPE